MVESLGARKRNTESENEQKDNCSDVVGRSKQSSRKSNDPHEHPPGTTPLACSQDSSNGEEQEDAHTDYDDDLREEVRHDCPLALQA